MPQSRLKHAVSGDLDDMTVKSAYKRWAPVYDVVFGGIFDIGRARAIEAVNRHSGHVLEVGVGTGIALPHIDRRIEVTGIDLSHDMLVRANERIARDRLHNVTGLSVMDASRMAFADDSFDAAVAMYLITTVPDPEGVLAEMERVVRPGGEVILVNHFGAEKGPRAAVERIMARRSRSLGWRPDFPIGRVLGRPGLALAERLTIGPMGVYTLLRFIKRGPEAATSAGAPAPAVAASPEAAPASP